MMPQRKRYSAEFKFKVALEAAKGTKTLNELASQYSVSPGRICEWKQELLEEGPSLFAPASSPSPREQTVDEDELYEQIGRLKMELEWLKKKSARYS